MHPARTSPLRLHCNPLPNTAYVTSNRSDRRLQWTREALADDTLALVSASSDASFRSYWRTVGTDPSWIVMDAPPEREDVRPWVDIAVRLRDAGLAAPQVRAQNVEEGFLLISDLGTRLYLPALDEDTADTLYGEALDALAAMSKIDARGLPAYDEARLVAEMELMPSWFLQRHLGYTPECEEWDVIESAFRALVDNANAQPRVFVHRDFHSRNLMLPTRDAHGPGIIDFQDAVRGPITYDAVSLLRDLYVEWPERRVYGWLDGLRARYQGLGFELEPERFRRWFDLMGVQRHLKVLGIFCRLWYRDGKAAYLGDLPLTWKYTREIGQRYEETRGLIALLEARIGARDLTKPAT
jgi:aminoglycoside/choline kinase family phosphotransferase